MMIPDPNATHNTKMVALQELTRSRLRNAMRVIDADPDECLAVAYGYVLDAIDGPITYAAHELLAIVCGAEQARSEHGRTLSIGRATTSRERVTARERALLRVNNAARGVLAQHTNGDPTP